MNQITRLSNLLILGMIALLFPLISSASEGKIIFNKSCKACHGKGENGAPKLGDKAAWEARIAKGAATLEQHAIRGFNGDVGVMPPKGGSSYLSDQQIKAAVVYMIEAGK